MSWRKVVSPTQQITFLGIELDSSTMSLRLPEDKLRRLIDLVNTFSQKASASNCQLQSLTGSLNFACQVFHGGRTFLRRVIDCLNKLNHSSHRCRLSPDFRADVSWWKAFLVTFNGRGMMFDFRQPVYIQTDASFHGFGAVSPDDWFAGSSAPSRESDLYSQSLPSHWCDDGHAIDPSLRFNINYLELFPVLIATRRWGSSWTNKRICMETDKTQAMVFLLTKALVKTLSLCLGYGSYFGLASVATFIFARATWLQ